LGKPARLENGAVAERAAIAVHSRYEKTFQEKVPVRLQHIVASAMTGVRSRRKAGRDGNT